MSSPLSREQKLAMLRRLQQKTSKALVVSDNQRRFWLSEKLQPGSYNMPNAVVLKGIWDIDVLRRSFESVVQRHEVLRTSYSFKEGQITQIIHSSAELDLPILDLSTLADSETQARTILNKDAWAHFDLEKGPVIRGLLIRISPEVHWLQITIHHIACDGWSLSILTKELMTHYQHYKLQEPLALETLSLQYSDYAKWQQTTEQKRQKNVDLTYWKHKLAGSKNLELPLDFARPAVLENRAERVSFRFSSVLSSSIERAAKKQHVSLYMWLLSSFFILLSRISKQSDIVLASPQAGRDRKELESLIGCFINTLLLRANVTEDMDFPALLRDVKDLVLETFDHNKAAFEDIVDYHVVQRDLSRPPLAQVAFALQNQPHSDIDENELSLGFLEADGMTVRFEMECHVWQSTDLQAPCIEGFFAYNTQLFSVERIHHLIDQWTSLLDQLVKDDTKLLTDYSLLSPQARSAQLGRSLGATNHVNHIKKSLAVLFEQSVVQNTHKVALRELSTQNECLIELTYLELDNRVTVRAQQMHAYGVRQADWVALRLERGCELVVTLLATARLGASYFPIDLAYPNERMAMMLEDSQAKLLVTSSSLKADVLDMQLPLLTIMCIDEPLNNTDQPSVLSVVDAMAPAYMMYSSGSTGKPKGIVVEQQGVVRLVCGNDYAPIHAGSCVAQVANTSFDAATFEIWGALLNGATLVLIPKETVLDPNEFAQALERHNVDTMFLTTALFNQIVMTRQDAFKGLSTLLVGGEVADGERMTQLINSGVGPARLLNIYGPTENTTFSSWYEAKSVQKNTVTMPIGLPISGSSCYVLDENLQPVANGISGQLYVGGLGVAQGYWKQATSTAVKFIPDPFSLMSGSRLYATGDLARINAYGDIEFLGRMDDQVKLRGYRIEPGAISAALVILVGVDLAHVLFDTSKKQLIAYWSGESSLDKETLRRHLMNYVAEYEMPSAFVYLDALPLSANGKIDSVNLPKPKASDYFGQIEQAYIWQKPYLDQKDNPVFSMVEQLWCKLLGLENINPDKDFFALGGHSLFATQMTTDLQAQLSMSLPVKLVFEAPKITDYVDQVTHFLREKRGSVLPPIEALENRQLAPVGKKQGVLSFAQQRLWFMEQINPLSPAYYINLVLQIDGDLNVPVLDQALKSIVIRHEVLRTVYLKTDSGQVIQRVIDVDKLNNYLWLESIMSSGESISDQVKAFAERPFDLTNNLMLRAMLIRTSEQQSVFAITLHHIAADGWSLGVLAHELSVAYRSALAGGDTQRPPLAIQYHDFAYWQRYSLGPVLDAQLTYWRDALKQLTHLELPLDRPRPAQQSYAGEVVKIEFDLPLSQAVGVFCKENNTTLYMGLLSVYQALLSRLSGQTDIVVGSPVANRNHAGLDSLIGFFVNMLVMRTDMVGNPNFHELLMRVRDVALNAYSNQDLPFEQVVEALMQERDGSMHPLFQVHFTLQNAPTGDVSLPELAVKALSSDIHWVRFDLECHLWLESDGQIRGYWVYNTDIFNHNSVIRFTQMYKELLQFWMRNPACPLLSVPLMPEIDRKVETPYLGQIPRTIQSDMGDNLPRLFAKMVLHYPYATAITLLNGEQPAAQVSYAELDRKSNKLAHQLLQLGLNNEDRVGLMAERGLELLIGLLAILKAGGVYVPLDPVYPSTRLQHMLEDAQPIFILSDQYFSNFAGVPVHVISTLLEQAQCNGEFELAPKVCIHPESAAYIIYTSGSTGKPKGVVVSHRNVTSLIASCDQKFSFNEQDVWTFFHSYAFDFSVWEIWGAWSHGANLLVIPKQLTRQPDEFLAVLENHKVTVLNQTPSAFYNLMAADERFTAPLNLALRWIIFGGETLEFNRLKTWFKRYGDSGEAEGRCRLVNMYGITETTVHVTYQEIDEMMTHQSSSHIGDAISHLQVHLLDSAMNSVPVGVVGEIYVGGMGVSRGYLNKASLTAVQFVPDPYSVDGSRLYRTGDLARRTIPGHLQYLGRIDQQVQLRGFRIELEEIEAHLTEHKSVQQAAVKVLNAGQDNATLAAYIVPNNALNDDQKLNNDVLKSWQTLYESVYEENSAEVNDDGFDIRGWNSSYTQSLIPSHIMREWLSSRLQRLRSLNPRKVLEIGCGSGMILHGLAPHVSHYRGIDISQATITKLKQQALARNWKHVELQVGAAHDLSQCEDAFYDLVILNSVVQYFPNQVYLQKVLEQSMKMLKPSGTLFLGDIRSLPRLTGFHASVIQYDNEVHAKIMSANEVLHLAQSRLKNEYELVLSPALFSDFSRDNNQVAGFSVDYQRGHQDNEMVNYRYDVCFWKRDPLSDEKNAEFNVTDSITQPIVMNELSSIEDLIVSLDAKEMTSTFVYLPYVLDKRVAETYRQLGLITNTCKAINPEELAEQVELKGYAVRIMPCVDREYGFSAVIYLSSLDVHSVKTLHQTVNELHDFGSVRNASMLSNSPKEQVMHDNELIEGLARAIKNKLPEHMWPASYTILSNLPMTINGKLNRATLPDPTCVLGIQEGDSEQANQMAPRTHVEMQLLQAWSDVTGVGRCGITDDFFALGGHSMTVMKLVDQIRKSMNITVPMAAVFQYPTVEKMANWIEVNNESDTSVLIPFKVISDAVETRETALPKPIFAFSPLTGIPLCYYELSQRLASDQSFYGFQAPGIKDNDQALDRVELMAERYVSEILNVQPNGPYRLMGWSLGGMIAFEVALQLQRQGHHVSQLMMIDAAPFSSFDEDLSGHFANPILFTANAMGISLEEHTENNIECLLEQGILQKVLPVWFDLLSLQRLSKVILASMKAYSTYEPSYYDGSMTIITAADNPAWKDAGPEQIWTNYCQSVAITVVPNGTHDNLLKDPQLKFILAKTELGK